MNVIDRYQPLALLGTGGFGAVYRAQHLHSGEQVALKVLDPSGAGTIGPESLREARALAGLSHPNVVRVLDCGIAPDGRAFVAMELVPGISLSKLLEHGFLPVARAADIALQLLEGLGAVHARGIVHRDVKPSNIMVAAHPSDPGRDWVRLIDFGISKLSDGATRASDSAPTGTGISMGTPGYMAPEQLGGAHAADARADIFAAGVIAYQMLCGRLPHPATSYEDYVVSVRTRPPTPLRQVLPPVSPALEAVVMRAIESDPARRFASAGEFAAALFAATRGPAVHAPDLRSTSGTPPAAVFETPRTQGPKRSANGLAVTGIVLGCLTAVGIGVAAIALLPKTASPAPSSSIATGTSTSPVAAPSAEEPHNKPGARGATSATGSGGSAPAKSAASEPRSPATPPPVTTTAGGPCPSLPPLSVVVASGPGVAIGPPDVVGHASASWMDEVAKKSVGPLQICRPQCGSVLVNVQLFLDPDGKVTTFGPAPNEPRTPALTCVGNHMQEAAPRHPAVPTDAPITEKPHGIVRYAVLLGAK